MPHNGFDISAAARQEMIEEGFDPDFPREAGEQLAALRDRAAPGAVGDVQDLRHLLWSSIDNESSRDLDQAEVAARVNDGIRVLIAVADVDSKPFNKYEELDDPPAAPSKLRPTGKDNVPAPSDLPAGPAPGTAPSSPPAASP